MSDRGGRLNSILTSFEPKKSYSEEINSNAALADLTRVFPNTCRGHLWVADVLYVAVRNFGVLHLAGKRQFIFGYAEILEALCRDGIISYSDIDALLSLRELKTIYRDGVEFSKDIEARVRLAVRSVPEEVLKKRIHGIPAQKILSTWDAIPSSAPTYLRVRNLEKLVMAACEINPAISGNVQVLKLKRWIRDPRAYATLLAINEETAFKVILSLTKDSSSRRNGWQYSAGHSAHNIRRKSLIRSTV